MALSPKESDDERGVTEASLVRIMGGQDSAMEEETHGLWGERNVLTEQYFPSIIHLEMEDGVLMLATEKINHMLAS